MNIFLILFIFLLVCMGPAYSQDNLDADISLADSDSSSMVLEENLDENIVLEDSNDDSDVLKDEAKTFYDLQTTINQAASGSEIELTSDYTYNPSTDSSKNGITISKAITINGNNRTIDGNGLSRIFQISGNNVVLKNLNLVNGYTLEYGGAVKWTGSNGKLLDSTLTNNSASIGGAIYWGGSNGLIENNTIENNHAISAAGAIYKDGSLVSNNNVFDGNTPANEKDVMQRSDLEVHKKTNQLFEFDGMVFGQKCLNKHRNAVTGYDFVMSNMSIVVNNLDGTNVADYIKIAFAYGLYYDGLVWEFTDYNYLKSTNANVKKAIELYNQGVRVGDTFKRKVDENTYELYTFKAVYSLNTNVQNLFLHNVTRYSIIRNLTVEKVALDPSVIVGDTTRFLINLTNTGNFELDNPYVIEYDFEGLTYDSYIDEGGNWDYNGDNQWTFHGTLGENESSHFIVVFKATEVGNFTNYIVAGVNDENISYANDTTSVNDTEHPDETDDTNNTDDTNESTANDDSATDDYNAENEVTEFDKESDDEIHNQEVDKESHEESNSNLSDSGELKEFSAKKTVAGNPLMLLFISLMLLIPGIRKIE